MLAVSKAVAYMQGVTSMGFSLKEGSRAFRLLVPNVASTKRGRWWPCFTGSFTSSGEDRHSLKSVKYSICCAFGTCCTPAPDEGAALAPGPADASAGPPLSSACCSFAALVPTADAMLQLPSVAARAAAAASRAAVAPALHMLQL